MTRKEVKHNLKAMEHWGNGGDLWFLGNGTDENPIWHKHNDTNMVFESMSKTAMIIEDRHFEVRKAFALGKEIQHKGNASLVWSDVGDYPLFSGTFNYRVKPQKVTKWQWICEDASSCCYYILTKQYYGCSEEVQDAMPSSRWLVIDKFYPSEKTFEE